MTSAIAFDQSRLSDLLASRQYQEALDYLNLVDVRSPSISRADLAQIFYTHARCLYAIGDYDKAAIKLKCSIKFADLLNDNLLYARQKYTLGQIYQEIGRLDAALNEYTEASAFFHRVKDTPRMLAAREMIALIHFQKGNYAQARGLNETILSQAKGLHLIEHVKVVTFNLCRVLLRTGDLRKALELLDSVADDCADPLSLTWLESIRGTLCVRLLDSDLARIHLDRALSCARENGYRRDEVVCMEYLGLNEYYEGNYAAAKRYYQQILAKPELTASAVAQTLRLLADVQVALGELDDAEKTANKAEEAITRIKEWVELGCLHRARALLLDKRGDRPAARDHFAKSFEVLSRHGARYELATTYLAAGRSACHSSEVQLERLNKSKSLFVDMDVPKRVAQVEQAIGALKDDDSPPRRRLGNAPTEETPVIITRSAKMLQLLDLVRRLRDSDANVLVTGETGTGKELLARHIHELSPRRAKPFRIVNCANLPETLVESLLFGCRKGVHSGSTTDQVGMIEAVDGGTFCFDEIGEIPEVVQAKLLRILDKKRILPLGEKQERLIDVRFIAMTNRDVDEMIKSGSFRDDLCYRLRRIHFHIPPLRERPEDVQPLIERFLVMRGIEPTKTDRILLEQLTDALRGYTWGGNVREVENMVSLALSLSESKDFPGFCTAFRSLMTELPALSKRERLLSVMERNDNNQTRAAQELGIAPSTFRDWLQKYGII